MKLTPNEKSFLNRLKQELGENENLSISYEDLYSSYEPELSICCSSLHYSINNMFNFLNNRITSGHFHADHSRETIYTIRKINNLVANLKSLNLKINDYYAKKINLINTFLSASGGSKIPENFEEINLLEVEPIFVEKDMIKREIKNFSMKKIGEGSYATVYKYYDDFYGEHFVIKKAKSNLSSKEFERFKKEFEIMKSLNSVFITKVYTFDSEKMEYTMEHIDYTLYKYLFSFGKKISNKDRFGIIAQILNAFEYLSSKEIYHRDISPNNILIKNCDDLPIIKLSDFGLVKEEKSNLTSVNSEIRGSFNDLIGLRKKGFSNYSITDETYALTLLIVFILTGKFENYHTIKTPLIKEFLNKGTSSDISFRFQNIEEIKTYFNNLRSKLI